MDKCTSGRSHINQMLKKKRTTKARVVGFFFGFPRQTKGGLSCGHKFELQPFGGHQLHGDFCPPIFIAIQACLKIPPPPPKLNGWCPLSSKQIYQKDTFIGNVSTAHTIENPIPRLLRLRDIARLEAQSLNRRLEPVQLKQAADVHGTRNS